MSNNTANGGAVRNEGGTLNILRSTFNANTAIGGGGAIFNVAGGTVNIANSTFAGNKAQQSGGAIYNENAYLNVASTTFADNSAASGAAIANYGKAALQNSIVTRSTGNGCSGSNPITGINNLSDGSCPGTLTDATNLSPSLAKNGATTSTFSLLAGSNAIQSGNGCTFLSSGNNPLFIDGASLLTDQRNYLRPNSPSKCDIGSFE